jgi:hypothetical protein
MDKTERTQRSISRIENFFSKMLAKASVSEHRFFGTLPPVMEGEWDDMVYVEVNRQSDMTAYQTGSVSVYLYARPTGNYLSKNVKLLDKMERALFAAVREEKSDEYSLDYNWTMSDYDDERRFHFNVYNFSIITI